MKTNKELLIDRENLLRQLKEKEIIADKLCDKLQALYNAQEEFSDGEILAQVRREKYAFLQQIANIDLVLRLRD